MSGDARDFNNIETWAIIEFFFLQCKAPKEIHAILIETLGEHAPLYTTVKNWVAQFKCGDFSTCDAPHPGRPKTLTTLQIIHQIHELTLEDHWIMAKSIAEWLGISHEWAGSIIHEDLDMRKLSVKWFPKCLNANQKVSGASCLSNCLNYFSAIQMIPCHECWPWTKPGYITITQRQNNIQWIDGMAAHPTPKNSKYKNPLEEFSSWFFGFKMASSSLIFFHRAKLSTQSITYLCWCNWRTFWRQNATGRSPRGSCSCTSMPWLTRHLQPRRNWPTWAYIILITHPILCIWPRQTTACFLDWKKIQLKGHHFCLTRRSLLLRRPGWTDKILNVFLSGLQKLEQWAKKCIELCGEYVSFDLYYDARKHKIKIYVE